MIMAMIGMFPLTIGCMKQVAGMFQTDDYSHCQTVAISIATLGVLFLFCSLLLRECKVDDDGGDASDTDESDDEAEENEFAGYVETNTDLSDVQRAAIVAVYARASPALVRGGPREPLPTYRVWVRCLCKHLSIPCCFSARGRGAERRASPKFVKSEQLMSERVADALRCVNETN